MPRSDRQAEGYRVFIGGVDPRVGKVELEREFDRFGTITDVWVARNPPGFAFIVYKHLEDAERAIRRMNRSSPFGSRLRVEHAANSIKYELEGNTTTHLSRFLLLGKILLSLFQNPHSINSQNRPFPSLYLFLRVRDVIMDQQAAVVDAGVTHQEVVVDHLRVVDR
ncbi:unnamed protein product [Hymenolepis diminuta]|uniref:RRM domain-containing protein n=1 Tax=Hymenolepis diminuta TaxID=6216 RepID=A0A564Z6A1_HYMDI|nr:unnamed protein product [Hymenolepis diminuta]